MERTPTKRVRKLRIPYTPSAHRQSSPIKVQKHRLINLVQDKTEQSSDPKKKHIRKFTKTRTFKKTKERSVPVAKDQHLLVPTPTVQPRLVVYSSSDSDQEEDDTVVELNPGDSLNNMDISDLPKSPEISQAENEWEDSEISFIDEENPENNLNTGIGPSFIQIGEFTTRSKKGFEIKVFDDYHFWFDKWDYLIPKKSYWSCKMKKYTKCRGRLIQDPDGTLRKGKFAHNHLPSDGEKEAMDWIVNARKLSIEKVK
jgi:hypothetical protein